MNSPVEDESTIPTDDVHGPPIDESDATTPTDDESSGGDTNDDPPVETGGDPMAWGRLDWIAVAALFAVSLILVGLHVRAYPTLSPIDELVHVDYLIRAGDFDPPEPRERIASDALAEAACRTLDVIEYRGPACGRTDYTPEDFGPRVIPNGAINTAAGQFPAYYTITGVISRAVVDVGLVESRVTVARMVGALWAGAGWSVMWAVLGLLRIPRVRRAGAIALLIITPLTLFHSATVNADAVLLLTGSLVVFATLKFVDHRLKWWWLIAAYLGLTMLEPTTALAVGACCGFLLVRVTLRSDRTPWERALPLTLLVLAAFQRLRLEGWIRDRITSLGGPTPSPQSAAGEGVIGAADPGLVETGALPAITEPFGVDWDRVLQQLGNVFSPVNRAYLPPFMRSEHSYQLIEMTDWLLIAGLFAVAAGLTSIVHTQSGTAASSEQLDPDLSEADQIAADNTLWLSRFGLLTLLVSGPAYTFSYAYFGTNDFDAPGRFGLPLVIFLVIGLSAAMTTRWARWVVFGVASLSAANTVWLLLTP